MNAGAAAKDPAEICLNVREYAKLLGVERLNSNTRATRIATNNGSNAENHLQIRHQTSYAISCAVEPVELCPTDSEIGARHLRRRTEKVARIQGLLSASRQLEMVLAANNRLNPETNSTQEYLEWSLTTTWFYKFRKQSTPQRSVYNAVVKRQLAIANGTEEKRSISHCN
ncbi:hypothetical protein WN51_12272 [Melipona quadrifasciata]|uniref:Uncharacterized protein n=1 Tax=Melipona quadrifasciata TaxID=166423 RepID=A0A0N0U5L5_9HYME|nr:hypothetical protein WN51_12272 [Melipona quadrifasciata]